jgi:hypothetical protein
MGMAPEDAGILAANIVLPVLAFIAVASRFYARKRICQPWGSDDYTILAALVRYQN